MDKIISKYVSCLNDEHIFLKPNIPLNRLYNAISSYAIEVKQEEVIALIDDTVFGGAKEGMIITYSGLYAKMAFQTRTVINFEHVNNVTFESGILNRNLFVNGAKFFSPALIDNGHLAMLTNFIREIKQHTVYVEECREVVNDSLESLTGKKINFNQPKINIMDDGKENEFLRRIQDHGVSYFQDTKDNYKDAMSDWINSRDDDLRSQADLIYDVLSLALMFPEYINRGNEYRSSFIRTIKKDSLYFCLIMLVSVRIYKAFEKYSDNSDNDAVKMNMINDLTGFLTLGYYAKIKYARDPSFLHKETSMQEFESSDLAKHFMILFKFFNNNSVSSYSSFIFRCICSINDGSRNSDIDNDLIKYIIGAYGEKLSRSISDYVSYVDKYIDDSFFKSMR